MVMKEQRRTEGLRNFSGITQSLVKGIMGKNAAVAFDLHLFWGQIVGDDLAVCSMPEKIDFKKNERQNGVLCIAVQNGAFALEIKHKEKIILQKVNAYFGYNAVSSMKIRQDYSIVMRESAKINEKTEKKMLVTKEEQTYIDAMSEELESESLKEKISSLGKMVFSENRCKDNEF